MTNTMIANANKMAEMINARGIKAEIMTKNTNGIEKIGICIGEGNVRPTIYPRLDMVDDFDKAVDEIISDYEKHKDTDGMFTDIIDNFTDFDFVKGGIIPCLVAKVTDDIVSRDYLDLKVIYKYVLPNKQTSVTVKPEHLNTWGVAEEELFNIAKENVKPTFVNKSMMETLSEMSGIPAEVMFPNIIDDPLRVFTTESKLWGASVLLFPELFVNMGNDVTILPSSVHEVIALPSTENGDDNFFVNMITEVNQTQVAPEEVLSNHPYYYSNGEIKGAA